MTYLRILPKELCDLIDHYANYEHLLALNSVFKLLGYNYMYSKNYTGPYIPKYYDENNFSFLKDFNLKYTLVTTSKDFQEHLDDKAFESHIVVDNEEILTEAKMTEIISSGPFLRMCQREISGNGSDLIPKINKYIAQYGNRLYIRWGS